MDNERLIRMSKIKKALVTVSIYLGFLILIYIFNNFLPDGGRFAPANGIFVMWAWLFYSPVATINSAIRYFNGDRNRLFSLLIHTIVMLILILMLLPFDGSFFDRF